MKETDMIDTHIREKVDRIVAGLGTGRESVIPVLQAIQKEFSFLPREALMRVCEITEITPAGIESVASFYSQFRFEPAGKHIISVCAGTACHVKGSLLIHDAIARELKLKDGQQTDAGNIFTLEKVACLGCCTLAPVVKVDETTYGHVKPGDVGQLLKDFLERTNDFQGKKSRRKLNAHAVQGEIRVGLGSCCVASGSAEVKNSIDEVIATAGLDIQVKQVGCRWNLQPGSLDRDRQAWKTRCVLYPYKTRRSSRDPDDPLQTLRFC